MVHPPMLLSFSVLIKYCFKSKQISVGAVYFGAWMEQLTYFALFCLGLYATIVYLAKGLLQSSKLPLLYKFPRLVTVRKGDASKQNLKALST